MGFVDGEGCFSCPIFRQPLDDASDGKCNLRSHVVQGESSRDVLEETGSVLRLRYVCTSTAGSDNQREDLCSYQRRTASEISRSVIVPFFEENPLRTAKRDNFAKFARGHRVWMQLSRRHLTVPGLIEIAEIAADDELSEAYREMLTNPQRPYADPLLRSREKKMRWSVPCGDVGRLAECRARQSGVHASPIGHQVTVSKSEIPCRVSSDLHEWRNDLATVSTRDPAKLQYE